MYRLMLYYLILLLGVAVLFSFLQVLPFNPLVLISSIFFLIFICWVTNTIFAKVFKAVTNVESVYISALILALIVTPANSLHDFIFLGWVGVLAMASKYIVAISKKHIFNPVALAVALTAIAINQSASWWVGNALMVPFVLVGGLLIVRKTRRFDLVWAFLLTCLITTFSFSLLKGVDLLTITRQVILVSPLLFFAFVMLIEPLTTPPTKKLQMIYGALVGFLFNPQIHVFSIYSTPELALLLGNIFSYLVSPKEKLVLKLKAKVQIAADIYHFVFQPDKKLAFLPGQYLEWTLGHQNPDSRGNRRYFTIASSPKADDIGIGIKFYDKSSSFKKSLLSMNIGDEIVAGQLAGEFTLPKDPHKKLVFIAGGIGITPFRSIIKYLLDTNQKRQIVLFYSNKTAAEIVYTDLFNQGVEQLGMKIVYTLTDSTQVPPNWPSRVGYLNEQMIKEEVGDYKERLFYLSGPHSMVTAFEKVLKDMGLKSNQIKIDFFPGFA